MHLKRLEIQGFKTFASRTIFEFRPGVTAVVGPNGSGKSNLADAVRWVLGEQSYAALRCKKTEELLFSGGGRRPPVGFAEVSLTIDNSDRLLPLDFDEVTVTRRATRAGENEYFLNRARVRLRDIQQAVEPLGGSYTIINQGLVDTALTLRPEERRRLFEDAAEIGGFELRKQEAERRLRETDANLDRISDLLGELEPRLRSLKRQASQARQHQELSTELHTLQQRFYVARTYAARAALAEAEAGLAHLDGELARAQVAQQTCTAELRGLRERLRASREQLGGLHQQSGELHRRAETLQRNLAVGGERLSAYLRRAEELERTRRELELRREEARQEHAAVADGLEAARTALAEQRTALEATQATLAEVERIRRELGRAVSVAEETAVKAAAAVAEQRSRGEQLAAGRMRLLQEQAGLDTQLAHAAERLAEAGRSAEAARADQEQAEAAAIAAAAALDNARTTLDSLRHERTSADETLAAARRSLADAEARLESLTRLARSYAGTFAGVKAAMQWAERSGRTGFALVSSIIRTPSEIETAVEVALGSRLQNIVVEQWEDAEQAIAELKRSGAGRATFLPLDTVRGQGPGGRGQGSGARGQEGHSPYSEPQSPIPDPRSLIPVIGVAAELVAYDPRYRDVVFALLGRVLVVRDMATARQELRRLSGGWTIVTLGGEQVQTGGAVTGGAQTKESGTLRRERELRELPAQVEAARTGVAAAEQARQLLDERIVTAQRTLREAEGASRDAVRATEGRRAATEAATRRIAQATQERDWQHSRREALVRDLAALDEQALAVASQLAGAEAAAAAAQEQLSAARARQAGDAEAGRAAQEQFATLRAVVAGAEGQVRAQTTLLATHEQAMRRLSQQLAEQERAAGELAAERERNLAAHTRDEALHAALLAEIDSLRAAIDPAEAALATDEARLGELEQQEQQATAALLEAESAHGRAALEVQRSRDRLENLLERAAAEGVEMDGGRGTGDGGEQADGRRGTGDGGELTDGRRGTVDGGELTDGRGQSGRAEPPSTVTHPPSTVPRPPSDEELAELPARIQTLRSRIERIGPINSLAMEEYAESSERLTFLSAQVADLRQARTTLQELIAELEATMRARFSETFRAVAAEFERSFTRLFGGGSARLLLVGEERTGENGVEEEYERAGANGSYGIEIIARPPGKRQQNLSLLSGGERSLTAAALLFAILAVNPSPFCILDEVDAALDESNVGRFRDVLGELTRTTQFIIITHNRGTIEAADTIYGVSMGDDSSSKVLSLRIEAFVEQGQARVEDG